MGIFRVVSLNLAHFGEGHGDLKGGLGHGIVEHVGFGLLVFCQWQRVNGLLSPSAEDDAEEKYYGDGFFHELIVDN